MLTSPSCQVLSDREKDSTRVKEPVASSSIKDEEMSDAEREAEVLCMPRVSYSYTSQAIITMKKNSLHLHLTIQNQLLTVNKSLLKSLGFSQVGPISFSITRMSALKNGLTWPFKAFFFLSK